MPPLAFILVIIAASFHALWNFATKKAAGDLATMWNGFAFACIVFAPLLFWLSPNQIALEEVYPYIIASGAIHAVYFFTLAKAYEYGEISVVYPIARGIGIAGTALAAALLINETLVPIGIVGILTISGGILLLGLNNHREKRGVSFALLVGLMILCYSIVDKLAVAISHPVFYIYGITLAFTLFLSPYVLVKRRRDMSFAWKSRKKYSLLIGVGSVGTYLIILFVYQMAQVSYVVAAREMSVAIGAILGFLFLKEPFTPRKALSIGAIVAGMVLLKLV